jgi:hypothetical protein
LLAERPGALCDAFGLLGLAAGASTTALGLNDIEKIDLPAESCPSSR